MNYRDEIKDYPPFNQEEAQDKKAALKYIEAFPNILTRENELVHVTASGWVVNASFDKVLMIFHNIYHSWSFAGGHADGEEELLKTAVKEVLEETGLDWVEPVTDRLFSLELICVNGHWKNGVYLSPHIHINGTYLLRAKENDPLRIKPDENSGVKWMRPEEAVRACTEPDMKLIYQKLSVKTLRRGDTIANERRRCNGAFTC